MGSPGPAIVTEVPNMELRSGTKLARKKYSFNDRGYAEGSGNEPEVVAAPWPATTPAAHQRSSRIVPTPPPPATPQYAQKKLASEEQATSIIPLIGTIILVLAVFFHWISSGSTAVVSSSVAHQRREVNADREQVLLAVLRQQDNAIQHWRSQQNLMWPVVLDLENKILAVGNQLGYNQNGVVQPSLHSSFVPLDCSGRDCTDVELEKALSYLIEQTSLLAEKMDAGKFPAVPRRAVKIGDIVSVEGTATEPVIDSNYCDRIGMSVGQGAPTMKDELACRWKYIVEATSRLSESYESMKKQYQQRIEQQEAHLGRLSDTFRISRQNDTVNFNSTDKVVNKTSFNFRDLVLESLQAEELSLALHSEDVVTRVADRILTDDTDLSYIVNGIGRTLLTEHLVRDSSMTTVMSVASEAKSIIGDDLAELHKMVPSSKAEDLRVEYITELDVSEYVQEIILMRKNDVIKRAQDQLMVIADHRAQGKYTPRPPGVYEYSSRMRGGRVFVRPFTSRLVDGAISLVDKASSKLVGKRVIEPSRIDISSNYLKRLTTEPFTLTGSVGPQTDRAAFHTELFSDTAVGTPLWAKGVLGAATGWGSGHSGADPQVVLNHLYPTEKEGDGAAAPIVEPGNCYAFASDHGNITIEFKAPILLHSIAIYHPHLSQLPPPLPIRDNSVAATRDSSIFKLGGVSSAPKNFSVYGWYGSNEPTAVVDKFDYNALSPVFLGTFAYQAVDSSTAVEKLVELQEYMFDFAACPTCRHIPMNAVTVSFGSNHGNPLFTCIYRIKVFGRLE